MTELRLPAWVYRVWSERLRRSSHAATGSSTTPARTAAARSWGRTRGEFADCAMADIRSEEHKYELASLMHIPYAAFCLQQKKKTWRRTLHKHHTNRKMKPNNPLTT